jgi:hypothetical protein
VGEIVGALVVMPQMQVNGNPAEQAPTPFVSNHDVEDVVLVSVDPLVVVVKPLQ